MKPEYEWNLSDGWPEPNGYKVFSCFAGGGGSSMGYRLAGFEVVGMNEIDQKMARRYKANLGEGLHYVEDIRYFRKRDSLPTELFQLDILDGSPPCSSFSTAGKREKDWGKKKKFAEGQARQTLDDLFFEFIALAERLRPRFVLTENVEGLVKGEAKAYVARIHADFEKAGYHVGRYLVDMSLMGLPQKRRRIFFIGARDDLLSFLPEQTDLFNKAPFLDLEFNKPLVPFGIIREDDPDICADLFMFPSQMKRWKLKKRGDLSLQAADERLGGKAPGTGAFFNHVLAYDEIALPTIAATSMSWPLLFDEPRRISTREMQLASSFPLDYDFGTRLKPGYVMGMSVPPMAIRKIAKRMRAQWLDRAKGR